MRARMASICRFSTVEEMTPNWTRVFVLSLDLCRISDTGNACSVWCVQFHLLEYEQETRWIQFASLSFTLSFQHHVHLQLRGRTQRTHQTLFRSVQSARQRHSHHLRVGTFFLPFGCWETPFVGFFVQPWFRCPSIFFAHHFFFCLRWIDMKQGCARLKPGHRGVSVGNAGPVAVLTASLLFSLSVARLV